MKHFTKSQIKAIAEKANSLIPSVTDWKQHCNRLHFGMKEGKQINFYVKGVFILGGFTVMKCSYSNIIFVHLGCGESFNVGINLADSSLIQFRGGYIGSGANY